MTPPEENDFREIRQILREAGVQSANNSTAIQSNTSSIAALTVAIGNLKDMMVLQQQAAEKMAKTAVDSVLTAISTANDSWMRTLIKWLLITVAAAAAGSEGLKALLARVLGV